MIHQKNTPYKQEADHPMPNNTNDYQQRFGDDEKQLQRLAVEAEETNSGDGDGGEK